MRLYALDSCENYISFEREHILVDEMSLGSHTLVLLW